MLRLRNINDISTSQLLEIYNHLAKSPIKKFRDRAAAEAKTEAEISRAQVDAVQWNKHLSQMPKPMLEHFPENMPNARFERLTVKEKTVLRIITKSSSNPITVQQIMMTSGGSDEVIRQLLAKLQVGKFLQMSDDNITLMRSTSEWLETQASQTDEEFGGADLRQADWAHPGPRSNFSGKRIFKISKSNPRKPGTLGHQSFELIKDGMTFEEYKKAGGRNQDLRWDAEHGFVEVK